MVVLITIQLNSIQDIYLDVSLQGVHTKLSFLFYGIFMGLPYASSPGTLEVRFQDATARFYDSFD